MRFSALVYKEFRECLPWVLCASIFLIACGFISLWVTVQPEHIDRYYPEFSSGTDVEMYRSTSDPDVTMWSFFRPAFISPVGIFLVLFTIGLGIALGIRQYWVGFFIKTWGFLLHRSVSRGVILLSKLVAALLSFVPMAVIWLIFYLYCHNREYFPVPPSGKILVTGLIFIAFGYVVYLAVALAGLSGARWYTTKMISMAFATWMFITLVVQWQLIWGWITVFIASAILLVQIVDVFLNREFE